MQNSKLPRRIASCDAPAFEGKVKTQTNESYALVRAHITRAPTVPNNGGHEAS
jgi:hypothetical protein